MRSVLALILGGGQGRRLHPLTEHRSKPAVPIGGKYRLVDIPISNCLHAEIRRIFVLTQFNSASLNQHVNQTYRMDLFSQGFVEILAAEQTPDNPHWYQGTADAVRQAARHFVRHDASHYLILAGDHLYRMDYREMVEAHVSHQADITIAAHPVTPEAATSMGIFQFDRDGRVIAFEEKPQTERLREMGGSMAPGVFAGAHSAEKPFVASMGVYLFSREVLLELLEASSVTDFGREVIPSALGRYRVNAFLFADYWADVGTVASFYDANILLTQPGAPFQFYHPHRPIYTHPRFLPGSRLNDCSLSDVILAEGCDLDRCTVTESVVGIRTHIRPGASIRRSVLLGADSYEVDRHRQGGGVRLGVGRDVTLNRVIVDKNARIGDGARLVNEHQLQEADGDGYCIRDSIIVVPKNSVVAPGTVV